MNYWKPADLLKNDLVDNIIGQDGLSCTERLYSAYTVQFTEYFSYCRKLGSAWTIYLGKETQSGPNVHEVSRKVSQVIVHPDYNNSYLNNDIALMKLSRSSVSLTTSNQSAWQVTPVSSSTRPSAGPLAGANLVMVRIPSSFRLAFKPYFFWDILSLIF